MRRLRFTLLITLVTVITVTTNVDAFMAPERMVGVIHFRGGTWPIHVDLGHAENTALLAFPAIGVAGIEASVTIEDDAIILDIPYGIGERRLVWDGDILNTAAGPDQRETVAVVLEPDPVDPPHRTSMTFESSGVTLTGTMWIPPGLGDARAPLVVVGHGASRYTRQMPEYRFWAEHLTRQGYAVFLYDKRGLGESEGQFENAMLEQLADDLVAAVNAAIKHDGVDPHRVALLGASQFGWLAFRAARELEINALVLMAPSAVDPATLEVQVLIDDLRAAGLTGEDLADATAFVRAYFAAARHPELFEPLLALAKDESAAHWIEYVPVPEQPSDQQWWGQHASFDPTDDIRACSVPVFASYGREDKIATPEINALRLERLLMESEGTLDLWIAEEANHRLEIPARMIDGDLRFPQLAPGLLERIESFLDQHMRD